MLRRLKRLRRPEGAGQSRSMHLGMKTTTTGTGEERADADPRPHKRRRLRDHTFVEGQRAARKTGGHRRCETMSMTPPHRGKTS
jgi:hypothetical protein